LYAPGLALVSRGVRFSQRATDVKPNLHWWMIFLWDLINGYFLTFGHYTWIKDTCLHDEVLNMMHDEWYPRVRMNSNKIRKLEYNFPSWYYSSWLAKSSFSYYYHYHKVDYDHNKEVIKLPRNIKGASVPRSTINPKITSKLFNDL
jgi:hypothetical protein